MAVARLFRCKRVFCLGMCLVPVLMELTFAAQRTPGPKVPSYKDPLGNVRLHRLLRKEFGQSPDLLARVMKFMNHPEGKRLLNNPDAYSIEEYDQRWDTVTKEIGLREHMKKYEEARNKFSDTTLAKTIFAKALQNVMLARSTPDKRQALELLGQVEADLLVFPMWVNDKKLTREREIEKVTRGIELILKPLFEDSVKRLDSVSPLEPKPPGWTEPPEYLYR